MTRRRGASRPPAASAVAFSCRWRYCTRAKVERMAAAWQQIVGSTHLQEAAYDDDRNTLSIRFRQNPRDTYTYRGVPPAEFSALMNSPRPGQHFRDRIKGHYSYTKGE